MIYVSSGPTGTFGFTIALVIFIILNLLPFLGTPLFLRGLGYCEGLSSIADKLYCLSFPSEIFVHDCTMWSLMIIMLCFQDIIWHAFKENCTARMVQHTAISNQHNGM